MKRIVTALLMVAALIGCTTPPSPQAPVDAQLVIDQCRIENVASPQLYAWGPPSGTPSGAAVVARRDQKYVLIIAFREPSSSNPNLSRWSRAETSIIYGGDGMEFEDWVLGEREFEEFPKKKDFIQLCDELLLEKSDNPWVFVEK